jgi:predicted transposase/invertase (TIGR01784 family)
VEFIALMKFIEYNKDEENNNIMASSNLDKIKARVARVKASEEVGVRYMQKWEEEALIRHEAMEQGREEGLEQGRNEQMVESIKNLMKNLGITAEEAMSNLGIASANYDKYLKML